MKRGLQKDWTIEVLANVTKGLQPAGVVGIHLAILREPYLSLVLDGRKTIESRFSLRATSPFGKVHPGDLLLLKRPAGPILGAAYVRRVEEHVRERDGWEHLRAHYSRPLCAEDAKFWVDRAKKKYATLVFLTGSRSVPPFMIRKQDRRPWVVLRPGQLAEHTVAGAPVIAVSGRIKVGKTSFAKVLAPGLDALVIGFRSFLEKVTGDTDRATLAAEGQRRVENDPEGFTRDVLVSGGWTAGQPAVIDGLRHHAIFETLTHLVSPQPCYLVYLDLPEDVLASRRSTSGNAGLDFDRHSTERDVHEGLRLAADLRLDAAQHPLVLRDETLCWLRRREHVLAMPPLFRC